MAALARELPDVVFRPTEMMSYEIVEALRSGQIDMGLTRMPGSDAEVESVHVVQDGFILAVPAGHPLATAPEPRLADLHGAAFVGYADDRGGYLREVHQRLFAATGIAPRIVQEVSQTHSLLALVDSGIGVGLVPASSQAMRMARLVYREIAIPGRFASDLYLAIGPKRRAALYARVRAAIVTELAEFGPAATPAPTAP